MKTTEKTFQGKPEKRMFAIPVQLFMCVMLVCASILCCYADGLYRSNDPLVPSYCRYNRDTFNPTHQDVAAAEARSRFESHQALLASAKKDMAGAYQHEMWRREATADARAMEMRMLDNERYQGGVSAERRAEIEGLQRDWFPWYQIEEARRRQGEQLFMRQQEDEGMSMQREQVMFPRIQQNRRVTQPSRQLPVEDDETSDYNAATSFRQPRARDNDTSCEQDDNYIPSDISNLSDAKRHFINKYSVRESRPGGELYLLSEADAKSRIESAWSHYLYSNYNDLMRRIRHAQAEKRFEAEKNYIAKVAELNALRQSVFGESSFADQQGPEKPEVENYYQWNSSVSGEDREALKREGRAKYLAACTTYAKWKLNQTNKSKVAKEQALNNALVKRKEVFDQYARECDDGWHLPEAPVASDYDRFSTFLNHYRNFALSQKGYKTLADAQSADRVLCDSLRSEAWNQWASRSKQ